MRQRGGLGAKFKVKRAWKSSNKEEWGAREQRDHTSQLSETEIRDKAKKHKDRRWRSGILCNKRGKKHSRTSQGSVGFSEYGLEL